MLSCDLNDSLMCGVFTAKLMWSIVIRITIKKTMMIVIKLHFILCLTNCCSKRYNFSAVNIITIVVAISTSSVIITAIMCAACYYW